MKKHIVFSSWLFILNHSTYDSNKRLSQRVHLHSFSKCLMSFRNSDGIDVDQTDFVPVFVYNDQLRSIVRNQLKRLDRVRIEGVLRHKVRIDETGKKQYQGYIEAMQIAKVISLNKIVAQFSHNEIKS